MSELTVDQLKEAQSRIASDLAKVQSCMVEKPDEVGDERYKLVQKFNALCEALRKIEDLLERRERQTARGGPTLTPGCYGIKGAYE